MGIISRLFGGGSPARAPDAGDAHLASVVQAYGEFYSLDDVAAIEFFRDGKISKTGITVSATAAMRNPAVFRSVSLIAQTVGMLPLHLIDKNTKEKARDHSLFPILHRKPNDWQSAYDFRMLMQMRVLVKGNAYAIIVRSPVTKKVLRLIPINPDHVKPILRADWTMAYEYRPPGKGLVTYPAGDILHLRGMSEDGISGMSLVSQAADAIGLALAAELAAARVFKNGSFINGTLNTAQKVSEPALLRLKETWRQFYAGADNAGMTPILEEGLEYKTIGLTSKDAQHNEVRGRQIEEIARVFGVPRPLLMVDDTSWGTGIEALGQFFVRYGLNPWFEAWQQAIERSLFTDADARDYEVKFNSGALTRGSLKDQGDYFAKASGAGGHRPWMTANEIRDVLDMPAHDEGDALDNPMMGHNGGPALEGAAA